MTFTYDLSNPGDRERVRYHIQDTDADAVMFSDEEIDFVLSEEGQDVGRTVISLIQAAIGKLAREPDMTADWLRIDWRRSSDNWKQMLREKRQKFGVRSVSTSSVHTYRVDSLADTEPYQD